jgi:hypothetical protein
MSARLALRFTSGTKFITVHFSWRCHPSCRESTTVTTDPFEANPQPGIAERAIDTATDVSRTLAEMTDGLRAAVNRLSVTIEDARRPGTTLSAVAAVTRQAPLASLFIAFLFGIAIARRH